jgi:hypothetical protein
MIHYPFRNYFSSKLGTVPLFPYPHTHSSSSSSSASASASVSIAIQSLTTDSISVDVSGNDHIPSVGISSNKSSSHELSSEKVNIAYKNTSLLDTQLEEMDYEFLKISQIQQTVKDDVISPNKPLTQSIHSFFPGNESLLESIIMADPNANHVLQHSTVLIESNIQSLHVEDLNDNLKSIEVESCLVSPIRQEDQTVETAIQLAESFLVIAVQQEESQGDRENAQTELQNQKETSQQTIEKRKDSQSNEEMTRGTLQIEDDEYVLV